MVLASLMSDESIIKYVRRGLNDVGVQNAIAGLTELHAAIMRYVENFASFRSLAKIFKV